MTEQQAQKETIKKSSYVDFMGESESVRAMREGLEQKIAVLDYYDAAKRDEIIIHAKLMVSRLSYLFTESEIMELKDVIEDMTMSSRNLSAVMHYAQSSSVNNIDECKRRLVAEFDDAILLFLASWNKFAEVHHASGLQTTSAQGEIDALYRSYNIPQFFSNGHGVLISPQMEVFCRWLYCRAKNNWDNVIICDGKPGVGKSSFTYAAVTTLADMFGTRIDLQTYEALIFKESRDYCKKLIKNCDRFTQMWYDEAGNQLNKRSYWVEEQSDLINDLALSRFSGFTVWLLWGDFKLMDSDMRNYRATALVSIKERGMAIIRQFNENPHANRGDTANSKMKHKNISSTSEAHMLLEQDFFTRLIVPFYDPSRNKEDKNWEAYYDRKSGAKHQESTLFSKAGKKGADENYKDFLIALDKDFIVEGNKINSAQMDRYATSINQYMTISALATRIAKATGTTTNKIMVRDITDANNGTIELDRVMCSYILRLKAEAAGIKDLKVHDKK